MVDAFGSRRDRAAMLIEDEDRVGAVDDDPTEAPLPDWDEVVGLLHANARNSHDDIAWARMIEELASLSSPS